MCDVPSIAVFCSESIERIPGTASKFFFKLLVTIPVAPIITGVIIIIIIIIIKTIIEWDAVVTEEVSTFEVRRRQSALITDSAFVISCGVWTGYELLEWWELHKCDYARNVYLGLLWQVHVSAASGRVLGSEIIDETG